MNRAVPLVFATVLAAGACARPVTGPQRYVVDVDAQSPKGEKLQFSAYFPGELTVTPGDTVAFKNRSSEAPHTITFGIEADRASQPRLLLGEERKRNPAVFASCHLPEAATETLARCAYPKLRHYDGTGYWNSGALEPGKAVALTVSKDTKPGGYTFVCVLHRFMSGRLNVTSEEADRATSSDVRADARAERAAVRKDARALRTPRVADSAEERTVVVGWGNRTTSVNRFAPDQLKVVAGTMVRFETKSPYEPHTVTFEPDERPDYLPALAPFGTESEGYHYGGPASSGVLGPKASFSLRFMQPGSYDYVCLLHPGQRGTVEVTEEV
jgi:plastocyanin